MAELTATPDLRGRGVRVGFSWAEGPQRPHLRLVRRRRAYPRDEEDGRVLVETEALFEGPLEPWARIEHVRGLAANSSAEGGLVLVELSLFFKRTGAPGKAVFAFFDTAQQQWSRETLSTVTKVERKQSTSSNRTEVTWDLTDSEVGSYSAILTRETGGLSHFTWRTPQNTPQVTVDVADELVITSTPSPADRLETTFTAVRAGQTAFTLVMEHSYEPDSGRWTYSITLDDQEPSTPGVPGLEAGSWHYYTVFLDPDSLPPGGGVTPQTVWRACALVTGDFGASDRLYGLLPGIHRYSDEPVPELAGKGQLRRFLQVFEASLNHVRGQGEGMLHRHDLAHASPRESERLARWVGWEPRPAGDERQREELRFAPEIFSMAGTAFLIRALVKGETGWACETRDLMRRVAVTGGGPLHLWDVWGATWHVGDQSFLSAAPYNPPATPGLEGKPAPVRDASNQRGIFWHSRRSGRRELWVRWSGANDNPRRVMDQAPDDAQGLEFADEHPTATLGPQHLWLFWNSNRSGKWEVWGRTFSRTHTSGTPDGVSEPVKLTNHATAEERHPAALTDAAGRTWVFWQSNRRGPTDIWSRALINGKWESPRRVTSSPFVDQTPAAVEDGSGQLQVLWSRDVGRRSRIYLSTLQSMGSSGEVWSEPQDLSSSPSPQVDTSLTRDEAPSAVWWNDRLWVFWHSNRTGAWTLWCRSRGANGWDAPAQVNVRFAGDALSLPKRQPVGSKEPAALVDAAGNLYLYWRSQWAYRLRRSRTVDTHDMQGLARRDKVDDPLAYVYDAGTGPADKHSRGCIGIYYTPPAGGGDPATLERAQSLVERFRPIAARYFWFSTTA